MKETDGKESNDAKNSPVGSECRTNGDGVCFSKRARAGRGVEHGVGWTNDEARD
jgi:hypothetical protein